MSNISILPIKAEKSLLSAAFQYALNGRKVFPLTPGGKEPAIQGGHGYKDATSDLQQIITWWTICPDANVGLVPNDDEVILDVDRKPGKPNGFETLNGCLKSNTPIFHTPNQGSHIFFKDPGRKLRQLPGVDVIKNGYIVAPPSVITPIVPPWETAQPTAYKSVRDLFTTEVQPMHPELLAKFPESPESPPEGSTDLPQLIARDQLPPVDVSSWKDFQRAYWERGDFSGYNNDESNAVHGMSTLLYMQGMTDEQVISHLASNEHCWLAAWKPQHNSTQSEARALGWLWGSCRKTQESRLKTAGEVFGPLSAEELANAPDYLQWVEHQRALRHQQRGTVPEPTGGMLSFADMSFEGGQDFVIDGLLPETGVGIVYGPPSSKKSFLMVDVAACIATGRAFHGHDTQGPGLAVYLAGEGEHGLKYRFEGWRREHGVDREALRPVMLHGYLDFSEDNLLKVRDLLNQAAYRAGMLPSVVVVDTLSKFLSGDENSAKDVNAFLRTMTAIANYYGCVVLIVHHTGHSDTSRSRGSSAIRAGVDFEFEVSDVRGLVYVEPGKPPKDSEPPEPLAFSTHVVTLDGLTNRKGQTMDTLTLRPGRLTDAKPDGRKEKLSAEQGYLANFIEDCLTTRGMPEVSTAYIWENCTDVTGGRLYSRKQHFQRALLALHGKNALYFDEVEKVVRRSPFNMVPSGG